MKTKFIVCELTTESLQNDSIDTISVETLKEWNSFDSELEAMQLIKDHFDESANSKLRLTIVKVFES